jgi:hypothetical protein
MLNTSWEHTQNIVCLCDVIEIKLHSFLNIVEKYVTNGVDINKQPTCTVQCVHSPHKRAYSK